MRRDLSHMNSGDTIGKYRLVSRLGRGGMGEVWLAKASGYGGFLKTVVVKTLLPELASDPLFVDLLAREAKVCATLSHPNLIEVFDFTEHGGIHLLAMEHVLGQPLNHILRATIERGWELPAWFALRIAWDCCCGLQYAHDQGIIHCDLSPSNVMVTFTGTTKLLDFGVAHASAHGPKSDRLKGKYSYMAPERITSRATDRRTDVYALGVMLYLLFTGRLPFSADTDAELLHKIVHQRPRPPSELCAIDPRIEQIILRAMQPVAAERHQTIAEVLAALAPVLDGHLGTYGQQHVAAYVNSLFTAHPAPAALPRIPQLPELPPLRREVPAQRPTTSTEALAEADVEIDVDDDAPDLATDLKTPPVMPAPIRGLERLGSSSMPPLAAPKPLIAAFAHAPPAAEPRTKVQSLFDERPSLVAGAARVFARGTRDDVQPAAAAALAATGWPKPAEPAPAAPDRRDAPPPSAPKGVFGGYGAARAAPEPAWPWPVSRTKSE